MQAWLSAVDPHRADVHAAGTCTSEEAQLRVQGVLHEVQQHHDGTRNMWSMLGQTDTINGQAKV